MKEGGREVNGVVGWTEEATEGRRRTVEVDSRRLWIRKTFGRIDSVTRYIWLQLNLSCALENIGVVTRVLLSLYCLSKFA